MLEARLRLLDRGVSPGFQLGEEELELRAHVLGEATVPRRVRVETVREQEVPVAGHTREEVGHEGERVGGGDAGVDPPQSA